MNIHLLLNFLRVGKIGEEHRSWILSSGESIPKISFGTAHKNFPRDKSIAQFAKLVAMTQHDVVR